MTHEQYQLLILEALEEGRVLSSTFMTLGNVYYRLSFGELQYSIDGENFVKAANTIENILEFDWNIL